MIHCTYDGQHIATGIDRYVNRDFIRPDFWRCMEELCQELSNIAFELYDRYGCLREDFIQHAVRKGTGYWRKELDCGFLLIIEYMHIDSAWRRRGIGKQMLASLVSKADANGREPSFTIVSPGYLRVDIDKKIAGKTDTEQKEIRSRAHDNATIFSRLVTSQSEVGWIIPYNCLS